MKYENMTELGDSIFRLKEWAKESAGRTVRIELNDITDVLVILSDEDGNVLHNVESSQLSVAADVALSAVVNTQDRR